MVFPSSHPWRDGPGLASTARGDSPRLLARHRAMRDDPPCPVPITIVAGFLGAGKTTLVNRLLAEAPVRLAVLVNDFAAINIDSRLIEAAAPDRISLTNGCVCCTLREDLLAAALRLAAADPPPERIVIETSGVAEPYGVMEAFLMPGADAHVVVESTVCVIDAEHFMALDYANTELAIDQAAVSDIVLLNKCDLASQDRVNEVESVLLGAQPGMRIQRTTHAELGWPVLLGIDARGPARKSPHTSHRHPAFASFSWQSSAPIDLAAFRQVAAALPRSVLRAKGILHFEDHAGERAVFQLVGKRSSLTLEPATHDTANQLVVIGPADSFDHAALRTLFDSLERT